MYDYCFFYLFAGEVYGRMRKIFIGDEKEYARRLTNYLLGHLPADMQLQSFTGPEILVQEEENADLYLLGEDFYEEVMELVPDFSQRDILLIHNQQAEDGFSRLDPPRKLVRQICDFRSSHDPAWGKHSGPCHLVALYAPFPDISLRRWIWKEMEAGALYLGLQDMGETEIPMPSGRRERRDYPVGIRRLAGKDFDAESEEAVPDMGSLCYYIHLHDEDILDKMKKMIHREEGKYFLDSPPWFFDFLGLQEEDYRWFFHTLREDSGFSRIYVGLGNNAIPSLEYLSLFDRMILLDSPGREKIHRFCARFVKTALEEGYLPESSIEVKDGSETDKCTYGWGESFETRRPF